MHQAPLMKEDDEYGMTCGKFGEPWLKNDETMNSCSNKLLHRQVGNSSVSMAERHSMLLIPLDVAFDLANEECVSTILDLESREAMTKYYNFVAGLSSTVKDKLHEVLRVSEYWDDASTLPGQR